MQTIKTGDKIKWKWGRSEAEGKVAQTFKKDVERQIKGKHVKRKADGKEPAYLIKQEDGDRVLKSESEVEKIHGR